MCLCFNFLDSDNYDNKVMQPSSGRSMGSRAAASLTRQLSDGSGDAVQGVICLSFPLHPPGQTHTHRQRSEDLRMLPEGVRVLFVSGTKDIMCDRVSLNPVWAYCNLVLDLAVSFLYLLHLCFSIVDAF